jgi:hypothetical protein
MNLKDIEHKDVDHKLQNKDIILNWLKSKQSEILLKAELLSFTLKMEAA